MAEVVKLQNEKDVLNADATDIAAMIREGGLSSESCVHIFIRQITTINPQLNAVVETRFTEALQEAKEKDALLAQGKVVFEDQPLFGVPVSIKESLDVSGMKTTGGLYNRSDLIMPNDASCVFKLKEAGAIILGKTNTPILNFCHETDNKMYGRTNNAWNERLSAGGSSGGEAALIAAGGSPLGLASDIGGSIRLPSHFNGVVGFKPGKYQVDAKGHFPPDNIALKARMSSIGPLAKSVRDVQMTYNIIAKPKKKKTLYEKMQIEVLPPDCGFPLSTDTANIMEDIKQFLKHSYEVFPSIPPYFNDSAVIWQELMSVDGGKQISELAFNTDRPNVWKHYLKEKVTGKTATHIYLSWALIGANIFKPNKKRRKEIEFFLKEGDHVLDHYLKNRLLIFPVYHKEALSHGQVFKEIFSVKRTYEKYMPYLAYANVWGLPSLTVPYKAADDKMPIAIQIMSKTGNEDAIFRAGKLMEEYLGRCERSTYYDND